MASTPERKSNVAFKRLRRGSYFADFRCKESENPPVYHCIIQRDGSGFIVSWTQHHTLEDAIREAEAELDLLVEGERYKPSEPPRAA